MLHHQMKEFLLSAAKFLEASGHRSFPGQPESTNPVQTETLNSDSSYDTGNSDDSLNPVLSDSPDSDSSKRIDDLIAELKSLSLKSRQDKPRDTGQQIRQSKQYHLSAQSIRHRMDEQFEKSKCDELDELIHNVERGKAEVLHPPGKDNLDKNNFAKDRTKMTTAEIDECFHSVAHVDQATRDKIE